MSNHDNNSGSDDDIQVSMSFSFKILQLSSKKMKKTRLVLDSDEEMDEPKGQIEEIAKKIKQDDIPKQNTKEQVDQNKNEEKKVKSVEKSSVQKQKTPQNDSIKKNSNNNQVQKSKQKIKQEDSSNEESEDDVKIKKVKKTEIKPKQTPPKKVEKYVEKKKKSEKTSNSKTKQAIESKPINLLVNDVLKRWWYCLPSWPPENYNYSESLMNNKLKLVDLNEWKFQPDIDSHQYQKVYQIAGYPGCFKNSKGEFFDLRPRESCPCFDNLQKKSAKELTELLLKALTNQIADFEKSGINDPKFVQELKSQQNKVQRLVQNFSSK